MKCISIVVLVASALFVGALAQVEDIQQVTTPNPSLVGRAFGIGSGLVNSVRNAVYHIPGAEQVGNVLGSAKNISEETVQKGVDAGKVVVERIRNAFHNTQSSIDVPATTLKPVAQKNAPVAQTDVPVAQTDVPEAQTDVPEAHTEVPVAQTDAPNAPTTAASA